MKRLLPALAAAFMAALMAVLTATSAFAAAPVVETEVSRATLLAERSAAAPGETVWLALKIDMKPGWHTFWRSAGDAGLPTDIRWTLPPGVTAGDIQWPTPDRIPYAHLMNFGYHDTVTLPVPLTIDPDEAAPGAYTVTADALWQVCDDICIPQEGTLALPLTIAADPPRQNTADGAAIAAARASLPQPAPWPVALGRADGHVVLSVGPGLTMDGVTSAVWFPAEANLIVNAAPQVFEATPVGFTLRVAADAYGVRATLPPQATGLVVMNPGTDTAAAYSFSTAMPAAAAPVAPAGDPTAALSLGVALLFAFLGGAILNLMPCVLPVLAMKAFSFMSTADPRALRRDGLAYTAGILFTATVLVGALLALRAAGEAVGWGFQLQSPVFVAVLAYVIMALGLSLSGVFALGGGVMGFGQSLAAKGGTAGAFFTGALVVVVATPCTAPLMGAALGFALTQPTAVALLIFEALALGLAAPYLLLCFAPGLAHRLPRPGPWMERLKNALAFPMYAAAAWLVWVLAQQVGAAGLAAALAGLILVALAAWAWGVSSAAAWRGVAAAALIIALALLPAVARDPIQVQTASAAEAWSPARVEELRAQNKPVFVNFTAAWCITCLVNERTALSSPAVAEAMQRRGVTYLKADWTNRNPEIAAALKAMGRSGVPLYVLYAPGGRVDILPQILTESAVVAAVNGL